MFSFALRGKTSIVEDVLTAGLLDVLRYSGDAQKLRALLATAVTLAGRFMVLPEFDAFEVEAWPQLEGREPDARITLLASGRVTGVVLIESKYGAHKTGTGDLDDAAQAPDQLADYLVRQSEDLEGAQPWLVYLTHHAAMPRFDLEESVRCLERHGRLDLAVQLSWLSWRDVASLLPAGRTPSPGGDLVALLRREGLVRFHGWDARSAQRLGSAHFFTPGRREHRALRLPDPPPRSAIRGWTYSAHQIDLHWPFPPRLSSTPHSFGSIR